MKVVKLPQALADLIETADFIAEDNPKVADRFFDAFEETIEVLSRTPKIGRLRHSAMLPIFECGLSEALTAV